MLTPARDQAEFHSSIDTPADDESGYIRHRKKPEPRRASDESERPLQDSQALEENVRAIQSWEQAALHSRSRAERLTDWLTRAAASEAVLIFHVVWFTAWILINLQLIPGIAPFDPFPFPLLTMTVSLDAIVLALFVLASQNRLAHQSDKRAHLNLQIDLLAEREMTIVLRLLQDIARHHDVKITVTPEQIRDLAKRTDIHNLANKVEEIPEQSEDAERPAADEASPRPGGAPAPE